MLKSKLLSWDQTTKDLLSEFMQLYKGFPCLWNNKHVLYNNKEARENAYEVLLEKYKEYQEDATTVDVRKRIDILRCGWRREHKKVLMSRLRGKKEYVPHLWYYELLSFLENICDLGVHVSSSEVEYASWEGPDNVDSADDDEDEESITTKVMAKKRKQSTSIYLKEQADADFDFEVDTNERQDENDTLENKGHINKFLSFADKDTAVDFFGKTIAMQLKELDMTQRHVAEKLMSDVIFLARMNKLTLDATVNP